MAGPPRVPMPLLGLGLTLGLVGTDTEEFMAPDGGRWNGPPAPPVAPPAAPPLGPPAVAVAVPLGADEFQVPKWPAPPNVSFPRTPVGGTFALGVFIFCCLMLWFWFWLWLYFLVYI